MRFQKTILMLLAGLFIAVALSPKPPKKNPLDAPYQQWSGVQAKELYNYSPWAQREIPVSVLAGESMQGDQNFRYGWTVRLISALPIREAYVRMLQVMNHYENMADDQRKNFDKQADSFLNADAGDEIILGVEYVTKDEDIGRSMRDLFSSGTVETLSPMAFLTSSRLGRLELVKYFPPDKQAFGARFIFPRTKNGQQALQSGDDELTFEFSPPKVKKLVVHFEPSKMIYQGKLAY